jgi:predicted HicB family RNase H-like nuclease
MAALDGIGNGVGFHADNAPDLKAAFAQAVDDYLDTCAKVGKTPNKPYSGALMVRIDPQVHANVAIAAELRGASINKWAEEKLSEAADQEMQG